MLGRKNEAGLMQTVIKIIDKAARGLLRDFYEINQMQWAYTSRIRFVDTAIRHSNQILLNELRLCGDDYSIISSETGIEANINPRGKWIVCPLDGVYNYLCGYPHWALSVALEYDGSIVLGVTYDPLRGEAFYAEQERGMFLNKRKVSVSPHDNFDMAHVVCSRIPSALRPFLEKIIDSKDRHEAHFASAQNGAAMRNIFASANREIKHSGAISLDLAYVACGRLSAAIMGDVMPHEIAAGNILISEAGGILTGIKDGLFLLAANFKLYNAICDIIEQTTDINLQ